MGVLMLRLTRSREVSVLLVNTCRAQGRGHNGRVLRRQSRGTLTISHQRLTPVESPAPARTPTLARFLRSATSSVMTSFREVPAEGQVLPLRQVRMVLAEEEERQAKRSGLAFLARSLADRVRRSQSPWVQAEMQAL